MQQSQIVKGAVARPLAQALLLPKPNLCRFIRRSVAVQSSLNTLSLQSGPTTISVPVPNAQVEQLAVAVNSLIKTFADKQKAEKPQRWEAVELKFAGDPAKGELPCLEFMCNPNAHSSAFEAKVLIKLRSADGLQVVTETTLEQVRAGLKDVILEMRAAAAGR